MIIVRKPSGDAIGERLIEIPSPELVSKYNAALDEIKRLQAASPSIARTQIKHVEIDRMVDSPELIAKVKRYEDQIAGLEAARLMLHQQLMNKQSQPPKVVKEYVPEKIVYVDKIVQRVVRKIDWAAVASAFVLGSVIATFLKKLL